MQKLPYRSKKLIKDEKHNFMCVYTPFYIDSSHSLAKTIYTKEKISLKVMLMIEPTIYHQ
jgi:hypothetical protein